MALFLANQVSLILLDVHLPDGNGLDLCRKIAVPSGLPILFISANDDVDTKLEGFAAGAVDYIAKPLSGPEVLARVRTHLRLRAAYESLAELHSERINRLVASQQSLMPLPGSLVEARFEVFLRQAMLAGGDFYDVIPSGSHSVDYIVADASGHDLGLSLWTASFKTLLAEYASILYTPTDILAILNASLLKILPEEKYFTAIYARLNRATRQLVLVNAGHPSAILYSTRTRSVRLLQQEGDLLGVFPEVSFGLLELEVEAGDRLFLYSDGLVELGASRWEGMTRLQEACRGYADLPLGAAVGAIARALREDSAYESEDDAVLMGIEV